MSWGNVIITSIGNICLFTAGMIAKYHVFARHIVPLIVQLTPLVLSWISFIILHNLQKCQQCCCTCCQFDQVYQKTYLDSHNPDELIELSRPIEQDVIEMVVQDPLIRENPQQSTLEDLTTLPKKLRNIASGSVFVNDVPRQSKLKSKFHIKIPIHD